MLNSTLRAVSGGRLAQGSELVSGWDTTDMH
jgi:hypothetical protein